MSRLGRSQPVQPFSSHGFVEPVPGPDTPAQPTVVENEHRRTLPLQPVIINGLYAVALAPTVIPPEPVVSVPPVRPREGPKQPLAAHGFDEVSPPTSKTFEPEDRRRRYWPLPPISLSGVLASFLQLFVSPPRPVVVEAPRNRTAAVPEPKSSHGFVDTTQPVAAPPPAINVDRADQRGRYRPLDAISLSAALASVTVAPTPVPPGPYVVPLEERRRFLAALQPTVSHGFVEPGPGPVGVTPPGPFVVPLDERRRFLVALPVTITHGIVDVLPPPPPPPPAPPARTWSPFIDRRNVRREECDPSGVSPPFVRPPE